MDENSRCRKCGGKLERKLVRNHDKVNAQHWYMYGFKCLGDCGTFYLDRNSIVNVKKPYAIR